MVAPARRDSCAPSWNLEASPHTQHARLQEPAELQDSRVSSATVDGKPVHTSNQDAGSVTTTTTLPLCAQRAPVPHP